MTHTLTLNEKTALSSIDRALKAARIRIAWDLLPDLKNPPEGDIFAFLLDKKDQSPTNEDFIFFNQEDGIGSAAHLSPHEDGTDARTGGVQSVILNLDQIRYDIVSIVVGFNLYRAGERDQSFRFIESLTLSVCDETGKELATHRLIPQDHRDTICMALLRLEREGNDWFVMAIEEAHPTFEHIARQHGIVVAGG